MRVSKGVWWEGREVCRGGGGGAYLEGVLEDVVGPGLVGHPLQVHVGTPQEEHLGGNQERVRHCPNDVGGSTYRLP